LQRVSGTVGEFAFVGEPFNIYFSVSIFTARRSAERSYAMVSRLSVCLWRWCTLAILWIFGK